MRFPIMLRRTHERLMYVQARRYSGDLAIEGVQKQSWRERAVRLGKLVDDMAGRLQTRQDEAEGLSIVPGGVVRPLELPEATQAEVDE